MAKTIKFNLILDEKPIRDIKGLQENFCIDDVLEFYQKGLLQKWLKVRGFDEHLKKVEEIKENESTILQLIKIFDIEKSEKEIKEAIYSLEFWEERKLELEEWNKKNTKVKEIIADYHKGYEALLAKVKENKEDMPFMKTAAKEIYNKYLEIFKIDYPFFFANFKKDVPLVIYALLMNQNLRKFFLEDEAIKSTLENEFQLLNLTKAKSTLYSNFGIFKNTDEKDYNEEEAIGKIQEKIKLHNFKGKTDGYWKDLEVAKTKVMVLSIPQYTFIRSANKPKEELSADDVNGEFLILDGLLYKSNTDQSSITYMEV
jgi:hypothetical protein